MNKKYPFVNEKRMAFSALSPDQQRVAEARFFNAKDGDGYTYVVGKDGIVSHRMKVVK